MKFFNRLTALVVIVTNLHVFVAFRYCVFVVTVSCNLY